MLLFSSINLGKKLIFGFREHAGRGPPGRHDGRHRRGGRVRLASGPRMMVGDPISSACPSALRGGALAVQLTALDRKLLPLARGAPATGVEAVYAMPLPFTDAAAAVGSDASLAGLVD